MAGKMLAVALFITGAIILFSIGAVILNEELTSEDLENLSEDEQETINPYDILEAEICCSSGYNKMNIGLKSNRDNLVINNIQINIALWEYVGLKFPQTIMKGQNYEFPLEAKAGELLTQETQFNVTISFNGLDNLILTQDVFTFQ
jgi:hypothetical protein